MKIIGILWFGTAALASLAGATESDFTVDTAHSQVLFEVSHLGISRVTGQFDQFEVELDLDPEDLASLRAVAVIQMESVDTREPDRDRHLKSADFFDAESHPTMRFVSTRAEVLSPTRLNLHGQLTLRGVTKPVTLGVDYRGIVSGLMGHEIAVFRAETSIQRKDFGVSWNKVLDTGGVVVGDEVHIEIQLEASRKARSTE